AGQRTTRNPPIPRIGLITPGSHILETRYGELDLWSDYGQNRMLLFQVFRDNTVSGKSKDPAGSRGLGMLAEAPVLDVEGPARPPSCNGMDATVIQSKADEQVFNIRGSHVWILNDGSAFSSQEGWLSEGCDNQLSNLFKRTQNGPEFR
ncbi:MAG: hypothetical protein OXI19_09505, partial [Gemmatimonadota bacterium]|nr:hypothetical protein [Gemmatimonadota bacterium]